MNTLHDEVIATVKTIYDLESGVGFAAGSTLIAWHNPDANVERMLSLNPLRLLSPSPGAFEVVDAHLTLGWGLDSLHLTMGKAVPDTVSNRRFTDKFRQSYEAHDHDVCHALSAELAAEGLRKTMLYRQRSPLLDGEVVRI